jgi:hypothetical protein
MAQLFCFFRFGLDASDRYSGFRQNGEQKIAKDKKQVAASLASAA